MASVLAIVSKAMFDKMVPADVALGTVIEIDRYVSKNAAFADLKPGDAIFMHTVRPPDEKLWLVAIIEAPKKKGDAFVGKVNTTPLTDITGAIKKLTLASGTGIKAKKGALGMSLQTPRVLTAEDVAVLRGMVGTPAKAKTKTKKAAAKKAPAKAPAKKITAQAAYNEAVKQVVEGRAKKKKKGAAAKLGGLRFENRREPFLDPVAKVPKTVRAQLDKLPIEDTTVDEVFAAKPGSEEGWFQATELIDVVDTASGKVLYNLYLYPFGDGSLFVADTTKEVGAVCQHGYEDIGNKGPVFVRDMALAYTEAQKRLGIAEMIDWSDEELSGDDEDDE